MTNTLVTETSVYGWLLIKQGKRATICGHIENERQIDKAKNAIPKR